MKSRYVPWGNLAPAMYEQTRSPSYRTSSEAQKRGGTRENAMFTLFRPPSAIRESQAEALAKDCCEVMTVIGVKLRAFSRSPTPPSSSSSVPSPLIGNARHAPRDNLAHVRPLVEHLAEACAPGIGSADGSGVSSGLSLVKSARSCEGPRGSDGSVALLGACAALHGHLLEWLATTERAQSDGARGLEDAESGGGGGRGISGVLSLSGKARRLHRGSRTP